MASVEAILSGSDRSPRARLLRPLLHLASWGYRGAIFARNRGYDLGWLKAHRLPRPTISVGNLTTGGTGKTPVVAWLVRAAQEAGHAPAILSRGYGRLEEGDNDEKRVLDRLCPGVPHGQGRDRVASATRVSRESEVSLFVLDDAFQHRRVRRDWNLVLIDALAPWGFGHVLPRGLLREPPSSLARADAFLVTRADLAGESAVAAIRAELARRGLTQPCAVSAFRPTGWRSLGGELVPLGAVRSDNALAFCGIGNPAGFGRTLGGTGVRATLRAFPDHHHYTEHDLRELQSEATRRGADVLVTTLKDLVKIPPDAPLSTPVWALEIGLELLECPPAWREGLDRVLALKS